jgi:hypothetical protein
MVTICFAIYLPPFVSALLREVHFTGGKMVEYTTALASQTVTSGIRACTLSQKRSMLISLGGWILGLYRGSLLRLALRGLCSCYHRIAFERSLRGTLRFDAVRQSIPQVPCSGSRNEMQFCTRSIQSLEQARPYMTLADGELFLQGWFQAARWYAHLDNQSGKAQQEPFSLPALKARQSYAAPSD